MLLRGKACVDHALKDGRTALMLAAQNGDTVLARTLLQNGAKLEARIPKSEEMALHLAANGGETNIASVLAAQLDDPDLRTSNGQTPLHFAASAGRVEVSWLLLHRGADAAARDASGRTPRMLSEEAGQRGWEAAFEP